MLSSNNLERISLGTPELALDDIYLNSQQSLLSFIMPESQSALPQNFNDDQFYHACHLCYAKSAGKYHSFNWKLTVFSSSHNGL